ncbi:RNAse P Rpr2/Rpp21 subunit domain [Cryptosporidium canis]|uniref:RNAse P Rpr2/Rpp21 subunit domain n=1 Tax=Cryptosporidium canis TaxID=195482 RepID=A0A9D5HXF1_9CRYT|nr:RNAse P Rpr2/Rpp21 subunit domain [Cryptosporidium canis]
MKNTSQVGSDNNREGGEGGRAAGAAPVYHRMNFLLQVSQRYAPVSTELSRYCYSQAAEISRKKLARIDPESRRLWCKRCNTHFIPGVTCELSLEERAVPRRGDSKDTETSSCSFQTNILNICNFCNWARRHSYRISREFESSDEVKMTTP